MDDRNAPENEHELRFQEALDALSDDPASVELDREQVRSLVHNLRVHQVELQMQNEQLREAQQVLEQARDRYSDLFNFSPIGYCELDERLLIKELNLTLGEMLGFPKHLLLRRPLARYVERPYLPLFLHTLDSVRENGEPQVIKVQLNGAEGRRFFVSVHALPVVARGDGGDRELRLAISDISQIHQLELELHIKSAAIENTMEGVMITRADNTICYVNPAFERTTGYTIEQVRGRNPSVLSSNRHDKRFYAAMWRDLQQQGHWRGEIWNRRRSGDIYPEWLSITTLKNEHGDVQYHVAVFSDITAQEEIKQRLHELAYYDPVTRLPNRHLFLDRIRQSLSEAKRRGSGLAVLFMDLDRFKEINDSLGHSYGDLLLQQVSERLRATLREADTVSRMGGDEFTVLLPDVATLNDVARVATKILDAIAEPFQLGSEQTNVGISIGIARYPDDGSDPETLIKHADLAMYRAKRGGRKTFQVFDKALTRELMRKLQLRKDLALALREDDLTLAYQPQYDLRSNELVGVEALLRWSHPQLGPVSPEEFIPLAEENELIIGLGEWVLRRACREFLELRDLGVDPVRVAVNLSPHQFTHERLIETIERVLEETGMPPECLGLEVTESAAMPDAERSIAILARARSLGLRISLDDFGTGFSSLTRLQRLPVDELKIDRAFVSDLADDANDLALTRTIIGMAANLGLDVVAEGIETRAQLRLLLESGCRFGQGFLLAKPMPMAALVGMQRAVPAT